MSYYSPMFTCLQAKDREIIEYEDNIRRLNDKIKADLKEIETLKGRIATVEQRMEAIA